MSLIGPQPTSRDVRYLVAVGGILLQNCFGP